MQMNLFYSRAVINVKRKAAAECTMFTLNAEQSLMYQEIKVAEFRRKIRLTKSETEVFKHLGPEK